MNTYLETRNQHLLKLKITRKTVVLALAGLTVIGATSALAESSGLRVLSSSESKELEKSLKNVTGAPQKQTKQGSTSLASNEGQYSAGDFYYQQGKRVSLRRSLTEYTVQFDAKLPREDMEATIKAFSPSGKVINEKRLKRRTLSVVKLSTVKQPVEIEEEIDKMQAQSDVAFAAPAFIHPQTNTRLLLTDEIVIKLKPGYKLDSLFGLMSSYGMTMTEKMFGTEDEYVLKISDPKAVNALEAANAVFENGSVEWAEPNFIQDYKKFFYPNDARLSHQWHLTGSRADGTPTADVDALRAWDITQGSPNITIAVLDDGVQWNHPDLVDNIFVNSGEIPRNGRDDDGNGLVDDVIGWDFANGDNDPGPYDAGSGDSHGTAVAGVAAARGNNGLGVSGSCPRCKILPVKIANDRGPGSNFENFSDVQAANAIRYAAHYADVLNNSWGGGAPSEVMHSAIRDATLYGRGGKGSVVLFASGNDASGYKPKIVSIPAGTHRFLWQYRKDESDIYDKGEDTAWLGWVTFPGAGPVNFGNLSSDWRTEGHQPWTIVKDPKHADEGLCFVHAAKAGAITDRQFTALGVVRTVPAGNLTFNAWVSSETGYDKFQLFVDLNNDGSWDRATDPQSGVPPVAQRGVVAYPAAFPEAIAVGATSDRDCRSHYSQFGPALDFVASSGGGVLNSRIATTDRTGAQGYDASGDYTATFSGTSSATPLAAGIVGLMLSRNPNLTQTQVRNILAYTADKIGTAPYNAAGRNNRYGYGRVNAYQAVQASLQ